MNDYLPLSIECSMLNDVSPSAAAIAIKQINNTTNATISEDMMSKDIVISEWVNT